MVTQILFGEHFEVISSDLKWAQIKLAFDGYVGWVDKKMITFITKRTYLQLSQKKAGVVLDFIKNAYKNGDETPIPLVAGSTLPMFNGKRSFRIDKNHYLIQGLYTQRRFKNIRDLIVHNAKQFLYSPYLWGGRSVLGIDCSGFTQIVYKMSRMRIPRDAGQQVKLGSPVNFVNEALPGDLVFFDDEEGNIIHTGIYLGNNQIIHASGFVKIDTLDHFGIFNNDAKRYTHKLRVIKDIISQINKPSKNE